jgi:LAS superfamily LD-carboxypeptidase LdcB
VVLQQEAMKSLESIEWVLRKKGIALIVVSSYRSCKEQAAIYNSGVRPAAKPGQSMHNIGVAVDLYFKPSQLDEIRAAFRNHNWQQFDPVNDPGHFTYRTKG